MGVTTAYELGKRGFQVTVLDRKDSCGAETSFANGAQLSYNHAEPWANPHVLTKLPKWLFHADAPLVFRPRADWQMWRWGLKFLRNCTSARARDNCINILRLGLYSRERMQALREEAGLAFDFSQRGIMEIFDTEKEWSHARRQMEFQAKFGGEEKALNVDEMLAVEPSLTHTKRTLAGAIYAHADETGDAYTFCNALANVAKKRYGVEFKCGVSVHGLRTMNHIITAVRTDQGDIAADAYVMAMGSYSPLYLRPLGIDLPIYPMKGYSVTLPANEYCPQMSVTDSTYKVVYTRVGDRLRLAGTAEFAGYNDRVNEKRIAPILRAAKSILPKADWDAKMEYWACLRPSTPDGPPVMGKTPIANLFLNTGHGTLGWTQAAGSATIVADIIEGKTPAIIMRGLTMERFR